MTAHRYEISRPRLLLGQPGTGKSTMARILIRRMLGDGRDIIIVHDPNGGSGASRPYPGRIWPSVESFRRAPTLRADERIHVFRAAGIAAVARLAAELGVVHRRRVVLVLDEFDAACPRGGGFVDDGEPCVLPWVDNGRGNIYAMLNYGRHMGVDLVGTARCAARIDTDAARNAQTLYLFRLEGDTDLQWVRRVTSKEVADACRLLPDMQAIVRESGRGVSKLMLR